MREKQGYREVMADIKSTFNVGMLTIKIPHCSLFLRMIGIGKNIYNAFAITLKCIKCAADTRCLVNFGRS